MDKQKTILVAEDDQLYASVYQNKLGKEGFNVVLAVNGVEALKKTKELKPDLVLLDLIMPEMDGFTALEKMKADPETKKNKGNCYVESGTGLGYQKSEGVGGGGILCEGQYFDPRFGK